MSKKYTAHVTISIPVEAENNDAAYDAAYHEVWQYMEAGSNTYIERIEIKDA